MVPPVCLTAKLKRPYFKIPFSISVKTQLVHSWYAQQCAVCTSFESSCFVPCFRFCKFQIYICLYPCKVSNVENTILQYSFQFSKRWNSIILHLPGRKSTEGLSDFSAVWAGFLWTAPIFFLLLWCIAPLFFPSTRMHITALARYVWVERKSQSSAGSTQGRCCWPLEQMDKGKLWSWQ